MPPAERGGYVWSIDDAVALEVLRPLGGRYLPWSAGAMRPTGVVAVLNEIVLGGRKRIVECGSGVSTVLVARLLAERGGRLVSIEHHPGWASFAEDELEAGGLTTHARVVRASLTPHRSALDGCKWYDGDAARAAAEALGGIDLLLVDGPPADRPEVALSRYPALPALFDLLSPAAVVILDDANRPGETRVLERWQHEFEIDFEIRPDLGWIAIGRR